MTAAAQVVAGGARADTDHTADDPRKFPATIFRFSPSIVFKAVSRGFPVP